MRSTKKLIAILLIAALFSSFCAQALGNVVPELSFTGTTANCSVSIKDRGKYINATLELWQGSTMVDSWSQSGYSSVTISGTHVCISGVTYTLKVSGTSGGVTISYTPVSGSC